MAAAGSRPLGFNGRAWSADAPCAAETLRPFCQDPARACHGQPSTVVPPLRLIEPGAVLCCAVLSHPAPCLPPPPILVCLRPVLGMPLRLDMPHTRCIPIVAPGSGATVTESLPLMPTSSTVEDDGKPSFSSLLSNERFPYRALLARQQQAQKLKHPLLHELHELRMPNRVRSTRVLTERWQAQQEGREYVGNEAHFGGSFKTMGTCVFANGGSSL